MRARRSIVLGLAASTLLLTLVPAVASAAPVREQTPPNCTDGYVGVVQPDGSIGLACVTTTTTAPPPTTPPPTQAPTAAPTTTKAPTPTPAPPSPTTTVAPGPAPAFGVVPMGAGARGNNVKALQQRLWNLGFWVDVADGKYGGVTTQAVMAFQKHSGLPASGRVDQRTADLLNWPLPHIGARASGRAGDYFEVDKSLQVGYIVRGGKTVWALNVSTGSNKPYKEFSAKLKRTVTGNARTPEGVFKVYMERPNGWWEGELGRMYRPKYVIGGVAVHGSGNIPNYPASHGCIRVSTTAMDWIWGAGQMPRGSVVWIHA